MGHLAGKKAYLDLQRRLDRMPVGAPAHRAFVELLEELFTEEECRVAAGIPLRLASLGAIARNAGMSEDATRAVLDRLAGKGLVVDLPRDGRATVYYLNPTVVGFFEFTMMRVRDEIDQKKVAELMWEYMREDPELGFMRMLGEGETFFARPLVNEDALEPEAFTEILDWDRASAIVDDAGSWAEGVCHCRHVKLHLGRRCDYPLDHCLALGTGADYLVRNGIAKRIDRSRARDVLAYAREHGNVQMADNVRNRPGFICNCCSCCCEIMEAFRTLPEMTRVVSSGYLARIESEACTGCGKCADRCPIDAIEMVSAGPTDRTPKRRKMAAVEVERCLGCGVCHAACEFGGLSMAAAPRRVYTPDNVIEKIALQAIERGKLQELLFNDPGRLSHRTLGALLRTIVKLPPAKQALASRQLRSRFVEMLTGTFRKGVAQTSVVSAEG
ncbi:MAG: 4Fe-4S binding protein [Thermoanaerobaculales bacterium]|jgi:ferredoxin|nr:4Fe-4S binding protein [Thermoanaerobaculales bacterium]